VKIQHELWDRKQKLVLAAWCSDLEQQLDGNWSQGGGGSMKLKEKLALLRSRTAGKSPSALLKHCSSAPFFLSDEQFITHLRLNMGQSPVRNPVMCALEVCPLCRQRMTTAHPLFCNRSAGQATIGRHNASLRILRCTFSRHNLALILERKICEPIRPNATGADRGKYAVRMDGIFAFKNGKVVELDFTWGAATAPSYLRKAMMGKLPVELEKAKVKAYDDRVRHNPRITETLCLFHWRVCIPLASGVSSSKILLKKLSVKSILLWIMTTMSMEDHGTGPNSSRIGFVVGFLLLQRDLIIKQYVIGSEELVRD
jgi:hypothetical protein